MAKEAKQYGMEESLNSRMGEENASLDIEIDDFDVNGM